LPAIPEVKKAVNICYKETQQTHLGVGFPGVNVMAAERETAQVLATLLGGNMSSRMFSEVREKRGLAYYVRTYSDNMFDEGILVTVAGVNNKKAVGAVEIIRDVYREVKAGVPEEELRRTKDYITGIMTLGYEDSEHRSESNALRQIYGLDYRSLEEKIVDVEAVTSAQVVALANRLFDESKICLALIGPFTDEAEFVKILAS
jgi:predicted Zn-dependent peptidase